MAHYIKCKDSNFKVDCKFHVTELKFHAFEIFLRTNQIPYRLVIETKQFVSFGIVLEYSIELTLEQFRILFNLNILRNFLSKQMLRKYEKRQNALLPHPQFGL